MYNWCVMFTCLCLPIGKGPNSGTATLTLLSRVASLFNIQRLVYRPFDIAWDAVCSHLLFILDDPAMPPPIRLQAARTLDDILVIVAWDLMAAPGDLQATVQHRVLDVLAQEIMLCGLTSSVSMELRRRLVQALRRCTRFCKHHWQVIRECFELGHELGVTQWSFLLSSGDVLLMWDLRYSITILLCCLLLSRSIQPCSTVVYLTQNGIVVMTNRKPLTRILSLHFLHGRSCSLSDLICLPRGLQNPEYAACIPHNFIPFLPVLPKLNLPTTGIVQC